MVASKVKGLLTTYKTQREVRIKDWRLGLIYWICFLAVFLYALVFVLLYHKSYNDVDEPQNTMRFNVIPPEHQKNPVDLPYCSQHAPFYKGNPTHTCLVNDEFEVVYPPANGNSLMLTTRQSISTNVTVPESCRTPSVIPKSCSNPTYDINTYFTANIEEFTVFVDHTMVAPRFKITKSFNEMNGKLVDKNGKTLKTWKKNQDIAQQRNIMSLTELLRAAGIDSLDEQGVVSYKGDNSTGRYDGLVLFVELEYNNFADDSLSPESFKTWEYEYKYSVQLVDNTQYKAYETIWIDYPTQKATNDRHGVRLIFQPAGRIGRFSFANTMVALVSSFGLLTAAVVIIDSLATTVMDDRNVYYNRKYLEIDHDNPRQRQSSEYGEPFLSPGENASESHNSDWAQA